MLTGPRPRSKHDETDIFSEQPGAARGHEYGRFDDLASALDLMSPPTALMQYAPVPLCRPWLQVRDRKISIEEALELAEQREQEESSYKLSNAEQVASSTKKLVYSHCTLVLY